MRVLLGTCMSAFLIFFLGGGGNARKVFLPRVRSNKKYYTYILGTAWYDDKLTDLLGGSGISKLGFTYSTTSRYVAWFIKINKNKIYYD